MAWSEDNIETLKRLWSAGDTASTIAEKMGPRFSRNAVVAKANRLGLESRGNPVRMAALHISVVRRLHSHLARLMLPSGSREGIIEALAWTYSATAEQVSSALGVPLSRVQSAIAWLEENYGGAPQ